MRILTRHANGLRTRNKTVLKSCLLTQLLKSQITLWFYVCFPNWIDKRILELNHLIELLQFELLFIVFAIQLLKS